jgi:hypothetical protein
VMPAVAGNSEALSPFAIAADEREEVVAAFSALHQDLATAERHIAESQERIAQQAKLVSGLEAEGYDATGAQNLLRLLQRNLALLNAHRERMMRELARPSDGER